MTEKKRKRGRPVKYPMPERIPDTPENIMRAFLNTAPTPARGWQFMRQRAAQRRT